MSKRTPLYNPIARLYCCDCDTTFEPNMNGESDNGLKRPQCPKCKEEIDILQKEERRDDAKV